MAKVTVEIDTETKNCVVNMNGMVLSDVQSFGFYKYSDCCDISVEERVKQDGLTVSKCYRACASKNQSLTVAEDKSQERIQKLSDYFTK